MSNQLVQDLYTRIRAGAFIPDAEQFPYGGTAQQRQAYRAEERRLIQVDFAAEALVATGLANHPKASQLFDFAYEREHSGGLHEVLCLLIDLAEVLA